jgi:hypothetical protein
MNRDWDHRQARFLILSDVFAGATYKVGPSTYELSQCTFDPAMLMRTENWEEVSLPPVDLAEARVVAPPCTAEGVEEISAMWKETLDRVANTTHVEMACRRLAADERLLGEADHEEKFVLARHLQTAAALRRGEEKLEKRRLALRQGPHPFLRACALPSRRRWISWRVTRGLCRRERSRHRG